MPRSAVVLAPGKRRLEESDVFYCRARRRRLTIGKCLVDYMNANALERKRAVCWHCTQGLQIRRLYAGERID